MVEQEEARKRLGAFVRQRRVQLDLSVRAIAKMAGVDRGTWQGLEDGTRTTRDHKLSGVERALLWAEGSVETILAGGRPELADQRSAEVDDEDLPTGEEIDDAQQRIVAASHVELVDLFRIVESAPGMSRSGADQWLVDALDLRERARRRKENTNRNVS